MYTKTYNAFYDQKDGWWIPIRNNGMVFHIDSTGKDEFIGLLSKGIKPFSRDICKTTLHNGKVFFFSRCAYEVWVYDKNQNSIEYYRYLDADVELISSVDIIGDKAWIIPNVYTGYVVSVDLENMNNVEVINLENNKAIESPITRTAVYETIIYFMNRNTNEIQLFAFDTLKKTILKTRIEDAKYVNCVAASDDSIWYIYKNKNDVALLGKIDKSFQKKDKFKLDNIQLPDTMAIDYYKMIVLNGTILAFSSLRGEVVSIDYKTGIVNKYIEETIDDQLSEPGAPLFNDIQVTVDGVIYMFSPVLGYIYAFSTTNNKCGLKKVDISENTYDSGIQKMMVKEEMIFENKQNSLDLFISAIAN